MNKGWILAVAALSLGSCVSKKKYNELAAQNKQTSDLLSQAKMELATCLDQQKAAEREKQYLMNSNQQLLNSVNELATLSKKEAENLERSLESIQQKDLQITSLNQAKSKRDSVTLALVTSLRGSADGLSDEDIAINVEKGVVMVSLSENMLFQTGKTTITPQAKKVLGKVAEIIKNKPEFEVLVEGHTDNVPQKGEAIKDNWDLSVLRATSIVRVLQSDYGVAPEKLIAAGRAEYLPVADNGSAEGKAKNRRIRILILPKIDEFYALIEEGMKQMKSNK
jgi:chemotaxis protein MotB